MQHLLLIAHGSRRETSNEEVRQLTQRMQAQIKPPYHSVSCAFLELATPAIPQALNQMIASNATHIVVLPYFLSAGRHVVEDIPSEVAKIQSLNVQIKIEIITHLGAIENISEILLEHALDRNNRY